MSQAQSRRGRKVAAKKRNPLVYFYWGVGAVIILGAAFLITYAVRGGFSTAAPSLVNAPVGLTAEGFYYKGDPEAAVKVVEYADYQCPTCAYFDRNLAPIIARDYIEPGKVQFIFHEFPLEDIHPHAVAAAEAARCAGDQGKFWEMHDLLLINQGTWSPLNSVTNVFSGYAGQIGLDRSAFDACLSSGTHRDAVTAAAESAIAAGISGTPTFDVNGQLVDLNGLPAAIEAALRAAGP